MKHTFFHHQQQKNILCLVADGLNIRFSGAYGDSLNLTPAFDDLACDSVLFDQYYITRMNPVDLYRQFWSGVPVLSSLQGEIQSNIKIPLPLLFRQNGYRTVFITDNDQWLPSESDNKMFTDIHCLNPPVHLSPVNRTEETVLYDIFSQLGSIIASLRKEGPKTPFFIWVHFRSLCEVWDAPLTWRDPACRDTALYDNGVSEISPNIDGIYSEVSPPKLRLDPLKKKQNDGELEQIAKYREAFCAQLAVWDNVLAGLIDYFTESGLWNDLLFLLSSSKGFPLGEHNVIGFPSVNSSSVNSPSNEIPDGTSLYSESIHLPLLIRFPSCQYAMQRYSVLVDPTDLGPLMTAWAGFRVGPENNLLSVIQDKTDKLHNHLIIQEKDENTTVQAILTKEWFLKTEVKRDNSDPSLFDGSFYDTSDEVELYVHPDDRWEVNNVADRCEGTVTDLLKDLNPK